MGSAEKTPDKQQFLSHESGSAVAAIFLGAVTTVGGSLLSGMICGAIYASSLARSGASAQDIVIASYRLEQGSWVFIVSTAFACAFSILGGYVCGRISGRSRFRDALILAAIIASLEFVATTGRYSSALRVALCIGQIVFVVMGAAIARAHSFKLTHP